VATEDFRQYQARKRLRRYALLWLAVCLFFIVYGAYTIWDSSYRLPHQYARLRDHGVRANAAFRGCEIRPLGRVRRCRLSLRFDGRVRTWIYPENYAQFRTLHAGAAVPVLVDPRDRNTVYTVTDVERRTNAGRSGSVLFWLGVAFLGNGLAGVGGFVWFFRPDPLSVFRLRDGAVS
jgi:hypothetical protein